MSDVYADVIVDISHEKVDRPFQYKIPASFTGKIEPGMCVRVPFGRGNKLLKAYVLRVTEVPDYEIDKIKEIAEMIPAGVSVESNQIKLATWMHKQYGCTMIQALKTVLPAKQAVKALEKKCVRLLPEASEAAELLEECNRKHRTARARLLQALLTNRELPYEWVTHELQIAGTTLKSMARDGMIEVIGESYYRNPVKDREEQDRPVILSPEQREIVKNITEEYEQGKRGTYLIHGVTGSGKTEVYMALIQNVIAKGQQAIVLIPEIALTYQTVLRFYRKFGNRVSVMNSTLSYGEKYDQCERARTGEIDVIIGPRSALFTPFPNIGLIIMDEEQENSYKSENTPKYHAREVAEKIAEIYHASVVLGSATPSLEAYYQAKKGAYKLFTLKQRVAGGNLPSVYTIDLREELKAGNRSIFSTKLQELIQDRLEKKEQMMLFLNRRGYAGFISCRACGHVMKCPHCEVSLSEHKNGKLVCHYCGYETAAVKICPSCGSKYILGFKAGTQQIVEKLRQKYPGIRVLRMDADTTRTKDSYEQILSAFERGEADVLVGTQMIVKGHDFPKVTLVGILAADLSLSVNDYRGGERTFQLLTQAAGRAGRGSRPGEVVIQTYQPEHYSIVHAAEQDYEGFYEEEILYREMLRYPPVSHMLAVMITAGEEEKGRELADKLAQTAKSYADCKEPIAKRLLVIGPGAAVISKIKDVYRFVFYIKYEKREKLMEIREVLEQEASGLQVRTAGVQFDMNPINPY